jgi:hypothetical protein
MAEEKKLAKPIFLKHRTDDSVDNDKKETTKTGRSRTKKTSNKKECFLAHLLSCR